MIRLSTNRECIIPVNRAARLTDRFDDARGREELGNETTLFAFPAISGFTVETITR